MKISWMRGQQTYPLTILLYLNMWTVSSDVSIKAPLAAALSSFTSLLYPPNPWCEWCGVCRLTTPPGSTSPPLFEQWCGFFYVPREPDKCTEVLWGGTYGFSSLSEKTRKSNHLQMSLQRQHALSSQLFKDPECWSSRGSNPWPSAQQTGALPTEPTRWGFWRWAIRCFQPSCCNKNPTSTYRRTKSKCEQHDSAVFVIFQTAFCRNSPRLYYTNRNGVVPRYCRCNVVFLAKQKV